jgi:hypothetical protein
LCRPHNAQSRIIQRGRGTRFVVGVGQPVPDNRYTFGATDLLDVPLYDYIAVFLAQLNGVADALGLSQAMSVTSQGGEDNVALRQDSDSLCQDEILNSSFLKSLKNSQKCDTI